MNKEEKKGTTLGASLLIAGCAIGAGMIGLPVVSALAGFIPSTVAMILVYFFATATGLLLVEAALWFEHKVHLVSLAKFALGNIGKGIAWVFFLFLFYCIFVAYITGGGQLFTQLLSTLFHGEYPREAGIFICVLVVGGLVYLGTQAVSYISRLFLLGSAISYAGLISLGLPYIEQQQIVHMNWSALFGTIPILFICFGYQNLIPTIVYYAKKNVVILRRAIFIGNLIPFLIYSLWDFVILGILPEMSSSALEKIVDQGNLVTGLLSKASESQSVLFFASTFSFFAILTPFMASTLAFVDFFKDGLKRFPKLQYEPFLYGLVLIPPTICTLLSPHLFLSALGFAGGFIDAVLFGVLPVLIVWSGRYVKKIHGPYKVAGGKPLLLVVLIFSSAVLIYRLSSMFL